MKNTNHTPVHTWARRLNLIIGGLAGLAGFGLGIGLAGSALIERASGELKPAQEANLACAEKLEKNQPCDVAQGHAMLKIQNNLAEMGMGTIVIIGTASILLLANAVMSDKRGEQPDTKPAPKARPSFPPPRQETG